MDAVKRPGRVWRRRHTLITRVKARIRTSLGYAVPEPPQVSGEAAIRALERLGFHRAGQHGAYVDLRRVLPDGTAKGCVVPLQDKVPSSVLMGILRQADVSADEFNRHL